MINFLHFYTCFNGSLVTLLDYYLETKTFNKMITIFYDNDLSNIQNMLREIYDINWAHLLKYFIHKDNFKQNTYYDTLVTTFAVFEYMYKRNLSFNFMGKKLVLLSSGAGMKAYLNDRLDVLLNVLERNFKFDEVYLLYPKTYIPLFQNKNIRNSIHQTHYYNKLSKKRLDMLCIKNNDLSFSSDIYEKHVKNQSNYSVHHYSSFLYNRWSMYNIEQKIYYEHIGKLMFEFVYFNKESYYSPKNKSFDDGLTDYLKTIFNLDDDKKFCLNQYLNKKDIINKMCLKQTDLFFQLL